LSSRLKDEFFNPKIKLPYNLKIEEVKQAMLDTYDFLDRINSTLLKHGYDPLEEYMESNAFSGLISSILIKNIEKNTTCLVKNRYVGGHPDLIPKDKYPEEGVLQAEEGIEVKASKQPGGWQGHNPEAGWFMVFRFIHEKGQPIRFVQVLIAKLEKSDWSFSGRREGSRRTITASITGSGLHKLRSNPIYQDPAYVVAKNRELKEYYKSLIPTQGALL